MYSTTIFILLLLILYGEWNELFELLIKQITKRNMLRNEALPILGDQKALVIISQIFSLLMNALRYATFLFF